MAILEEIAEFDLMQLDQLPQELIVDCAERMKDKKASVRGVAIKTMGKIFSCVFSLLSENADNRAAQVCLSLSLIRMFEYLCLGKVWMDSMSHSRTRLPSSQ